MNAFPRLCRSFPRRAYHTRPSPPPRKQAQPKWLYTCAFIPVAIGSVGAVVLYNVFLYVYPQRPHHLNPDYFIPYTLYQHKEVSEMPQKTSILTLVSQFPAPQTTDTVSSVEIKQPALQISRHYTPLPSKDPRVLRLLIKLEPGGEMSRYLLDQREGVQIFVRGPYTEWDLKGKTKVFFIAGGTGITPALQAADKLLSTNKEAAMRILWGVRDKAEAGGETAKIVEELKSRFGGRLDVGLRPDGRGAPGIVLKEVKELVDWASSVVVSGPEGFVELFAGEKEWVGGVETQGRIGGVVGDMMKGRQGVEVWKL